MKKAVIFGTMFGALFVFTSCKSREDAYRQLYEQAQAQEASTSQEQGTPVSVAPVAPREETVTVTNVAGRDTNAGEDLSGTKTIEGGVAVISGGELKRFSVVVGSFITQANAEALMGTLKTKGYDARVVKTNETINGQTGWFRVVASSYDDKVSAVQSRDELKASYPGAWILRK